jgi:hypothetical protein
MRSIARCHIGAPVELLTWKSAGVMSDIGAV